MTALLAEAGCENRAIMAVTGQGGDRQAGGAPETQGERNRGKPDGKPGQRC